jgi:hypothetical protein
MIRSAIEALKDMRDARRFPARPDLWPLRDNWVTCRDESGEVLVAWRQPKLEGRE